MNCRFLKLFLNMKRLQILFFLSALLLCVPAVHAQSTMTDQQIMDFYVKSKSDGRTVAQIVTQLMERGVTVERIRKIRRNYEAQQKKEVVGADDISGVSGKTVERLRKGKKVQQTPENKNFPQRDVKQKKVEGLSPYEMEEMQDQEFREMSRELDFLMPEDSLRHLAKQKVEDKTKKVFGRDIFNNNKLTFEPEMNIATPSDYRLGPGDAVYIDVWGASQKQYTSTVSPEGVVNIEGFGPVQVSGMTVAQANAKAAGVADLILIGNPAAIAQLAKEHGLENLDKATVVDPLDHPKKEEYAQLLAELRAKKGMTIEQARVLVENPLYLGCLMIKAGDADGQLAGALHTTGDELRPALQIIKTAPGITCVSGAMLLLTQATEYGENGVVVMGDVAVTPVPDANQLAQIAVCSAETAQAVAGIEPRVAMLSFSTKGSAKHEDVDKVVEALNIARGLRPELKIDGELQADAALVPSVGEFKAPGSTVAGHANVLVAPRLEVGNIAYKLVERLGHAEAIGPILQGIARPVNDLSRGCCSQDIYTMVAITANQAIAAKAR